MKKSLEIYKVKDKNEKYYTKKDIISDIPFRICIVGKSQLSGKTNLLVNLLLRDEFYKNDFIGKNIFLISGSVGNDAKLQTLIDQKQIEPQNIFSEYDEELIEALYEMLQDEFEEAIENNKRPKNTLVIFDDMSFGGIFKGKNFGVINKMFSNGRHINLSCIITAQKYSTIGSNQRENMTMGIFFSCSDKQLELITEDINYLTDKKSFKSRYRKVCNEKHSFFVVNFTNPKESMYLNSKFEPIEFHEDHVPSPLGNEVKSTIVKLKPKNGEEDYSNFEDYEPLPKSKR